MFCQNAHDMIVSQKSRVQSCIWRITYSKAFFWGGAWLAQLVEQPTLDLGVMSLSPTLGMEPTLKKKI